MRTVIIRDDDTNAFTPVECLERLYRPFIERDLPVNLAVIPDVRSDVRLPDGRLEGFLFAKNGATQPTAPIRSDSRLARYILGNPTLHVVQHGCHHDYLEFDSSDASRVSQRLEHGARLLSEAGFNAPDTFVAPYDRFTRTSLREVSKRFPVISTGWFEWRRCPRAWWARYAMKKLTHAPHWHAGNSILLSHPGCLLSNQRDLATMFEKVVRQIESRRLTVLVTHWWEYFSDGKPNEPFIAVLHEVAKYLASHKGVSVIPFSRLRCAGVSLN